MEIKTKSPTQEPGPMNRTDRLHRGAGKPQASKKKDKTPTLMPLFVIGVMVLLVIALLLKVDITGENAAPKLSPQEDAKLQRRLKEIDDSEQYALVATEDGWYPCLHRGFKTYYLLSGEVWKYGVTSKGKFGRYTAAFLYKNSVTYMVQFKGNFSECLKQEQIRLFNYPYLPENLARPLEKRLRRPPYNPIMR